MDIKIHNHTFLGHMGRKNVDPARFIEYLNDRLAASTCSITPFLHIGGVDMANIVSTINNDSATTRHVGEIVVRTRNGGTLLYQDMDVVLREMLLLRSSEHVPAEYVSGYGSIGVVPPLHIHVHASSDGRPAMVRRHDALYRGLLHKDVPAPAKIAQLFPTEQMLDASLDGRWHYM